MPVNRFSFLVIAAVAAVGCVALPSDSPSPGPSATPAAGGQATPAPGTAEPTASVASPLPSVGATEEPKPTETSAQATVQPSASPSGPAATPTSQPTANAGDAARLVVDWQRQRTDPEIGFFGEEPFLLPTATVFNGRFVVLGHGYREASRSEAPEIWTSSNGARWAPASVDGITPEAQATGVELRLTDVTLGGPGLVAVGFEDDAGTNGAVWVSSDGNAWTRVYDDDLHQTGRLSWVWNEGDHLLAYGAGRLLSSTDGISWEPVATGEGPDRWAAAAIKSDAGLTVFAREGESERAPISVWRLTSLGWQRLSELPDSGRASVDTGSVGPRGWVATGARYRRGTVDGVAWWSPDGQAWQAAAVPPGLIASDIFADEAGFIAAGYQPPAGCAWDMSGIHGSTWTSVDGLTWREMEGGDWARRGIFVLLRSGRTLIGVGVDYTDENNPGVGAVWTARLPQTQPLDDEPAQPTGGSPSGCG